jgi:hypothetical protein
MGIVVGPSLGAEGEGFPVRSSTPNPKELGWDHWYNGDNVILTGGKVSTMTDLIGTNNFDQIIDAVRPTHTVSDSEFNNLGSVGFAGADLTVVAPAGFGATMNGSWSMFWIGKQATSDERVWFQDVSQGTGGFVEVVSGNMTVNISGISKSSTSGDDGTAVQLRGLTSDGTNIYFHIGQSTVDSVVIGGTMNWEVTQFGNYNGTTFDFNGELAEVVFKDSYVSGTPLANIKSYFQKRYNL